MYRGDEVLKYISCLVEWALPEKRATTRGTDTNFDYRAPSPELGQLQFPAGSDAEAAPTTRYAAPFNIAFNTHLGMFPWLELPENKSRLVRFSHGIAGTRQCEAENEILRGMSESRVPPCLRDTPMSTLHIGFSWEDLPQGSVLVDVGGGIGAQAVVVADAHSHIHVVVEDRAQVISTAASVRPLPIFRFSLTII